MTIATILDILSFFCLTTDLYANGPEWVQRWVKSRRAAFGLSRMETGTSAVIAIFSIIIAFFIVPPLFHRFVTSAEALYSVFHYIFGLFMSAGDSIPTRYHDRQYPDAENALRILPELRHAFATSGLPSFVAPVVFTVILLLTMIVACALPFGVLVFSGCILLGVFWIVNASTMASVLGLVQNYTFKWALTLLGAVLFMIARLIS